MRWGLGTGGASLAVLLLLYLALRLPALTADPPAGLVSHYQDYAFSVFDEGWWTANAREAVLFGSLRGTGFDLFWVSPVFTLLMTVAFSVGGTSLATARLLSIFMGGAAVALLWRSGRTGHSGRETSDRRAALTTAWAASLWVVAFAPAQLGRLAVPETSGIALGLAGAVALLSGRAIGSFAAGFFAVLAMLVKPHFGFLIPTFLATSTVLSIRHERRVLPGLGWTAFGAAVPVAAWGIFVGTHATEAAELMSFYLHDRWFAGVPPELGRLAWIKPAAQVLISGVVYRHHFFAYLPGVFLLAAIAAPAAWTAVVRPRRTSTVPDVVILFGLWALIGGGLISSLPFQPLRYYRPLIPALVVLAAWALTASRSARRSDEGATSREAPRGRGTGEERESWWTVAIRFGIGIFVAVQILFAVLQAWLPAEAVARSSGRVALMNPVEFHLAPFLVHLAKSRSLAPFEALPREIAAMAGLALCGALSLGAGTIFAIVGARPWTRSLRALETWIPRNGRVPIVVAMVAFQTFHWIRWIPDRAETIPEMSRAIDRLVPAEAIVSPAGSYSLGSPLRFDTSAVRAGGMFDASGAADYFVVLAGHPRIGVLPVGEIERRYPGSIRVAEFDLTGEYLYHLYRASVADSGR